MPTTVEKDKEIDILELLPPDEGSMRQYYGRIGSGKTFCATQDVLSDLRRGQVVYTNWKIVWNGYDQRDYFIFRLLGAIGLKRKFWIFPKENLHYIDIHNLDSVIVDGIDTKMDFYKWFSTLTSCIVYLDEGHIYYDSYLATKMNLGVRVAILDTRHYDRTVNIISQRPTAIHAVLRGNVNQFFKVEPLTNFFTIPRFLRTEFQDTKGDDTPNEERERITDKDTGEVSMGDYLFKVEQKTYWGFAKDFALYNSKFRRDGVSESQVNKGHLLPVTWWKRVKILFWHD